MNCDELRKDIAAIKSSRSTMQEQYDHMNKTGTSGKADFAESRITTEKLVDEILEKYLPDFAEKNPELFNWQPEAEIELEYGPTGAAIQYGEELLFGGHRRCYRIPKSFTAESKVTETGTGKHIRQFLFCSDGKIAGLGLDGLSIYKKREDGELELEGEITQFKNERGDECSTKTMIELSDGKILVGGRYGMLCECSNVINPSWGISKQIPGLFKEDKSCDIETFHKTPDGDILIIAEQLLFKYSKNLNSSEWKLIDKKDKLLKQDSNSNIKYDRISASHMENGRLTIVVTDLFGNSRINQYDYNGNTREFDLIDSSDLIIDNEEESNREMENIKNIIPINDGKKMIVNTKSYVKDLGTLLECKKNQEGKWVISQVIGHFDKEENDPDDTIDHRIIGISIIDNNIIISRRDDTVIKYARRPNSVEELKDNIDKIIEKGEA